LFDNWRELIRDAAAAIPRPFRTGDEGSDEAPDFKSAGKEAGLNGAGIVS
jgi:hypothetical protein